MRSVIRRGQRPEMCGRATASGLQHAADSSSFYRDCRLPGKVAALIRAEFASVVAIKESG
jgi:hypothetical protein